MSEPVHNTNHATEIVDLLIQQFKNDPGMTGFASIFGAKVQEIEDALWQLYTLRGIDTALGAQLDNLGKVIGYPRQGLSDNDYRLRLKAKIALNRDSGTTAEILSIFGLLLPTLSLQLTETPPGGFELHVVGVIPGTISVSELGAILQSARAACIEAQLIYSPVIPANTFTYDTGPGYDAGQYAGSI